MRKNSLGFVASESTWMLIFGTSRLGTKAGQSCASEFLLRRIRAVGILELAGCRQSTVELSIQVKKYISGWKVIPLFMLAAICAPAQTFEINGQQKTAAAPAKPSR